MRLFAARIARELTTVSPSARVPRKTCTTIRRNRPVAKVSETATRERNIYLIGRNDPYRRYFGVQTFERDRHFGGARPITHIVGFEDATVAVDMACHMTEDDRLGRASEYVLDSPNIDLLLLLKLCRHVSMVGDESLNAMESTFLEAIAFADAETFCHNRGMALTVIDAKHADDGSRYETTLSKHYPPREYKDYAPFLNDVLSSSDKTSDENPT